MVEGPPGWHGSQFARPPLPRDCPFCRGRIRSGSSLVCPLCHDSGYRVQLAMQRKIAGSPGSARVVYPSPQISRKIHFVCAQVRAKAQRMKRPGVKP